MKSKSIILLVFIFLLTVVLISCDNNSIENTDTSNNIIKPTHKISISFDSSGGNTIESIEQFVDKLYELPIPNKKGYTFDGWYNGSELIKISGVWTIEENVELTAKWTATKYSINYITLGGNNANPSTYTIEDEIVFKALEWIVGENDTIAYEFAGWYKDAGYNEPFEKIEIGSTGVIDVYAKWNAINIPEEKTETAITFKAEGFECDKFEQTVMVGEHYLFPHLEKEGHIFLGWKSEDGSVTVSTSGIWVQSNSNLTLVPNWSKRAYSITYVLNDGKNNDQNPETFYITDTVILYHPTKENYYFDGWYLDEKFENKIEKIDVGTKTEITLYAKWLAMYVITYDSIEENNQQFVILDKEYSLKNIEKPGYIFEGWYFDGSLINSNGIWTIAGNVDLVAKWTKQKYSIAYDFNGGKADKGVYPESYDIETDKLQIGIPSRDGYKFIGWENESKIDYYYRINSGSYGDVSLKAIWHKIEYTYQDSIGIQYLLIDDDTLSVVGYVGKVGDIIIPSSYNDYIVTEIGEYAFCGYGDKLANINSNSFFRCFIPETVTKISKGAFIACDDLKVQLFYNSSITVDEWTDKLIIEERNNHVLDVIRGSRPAIGWNKYWIPGQ